MTPGARDGGSLRMAQPAPVWYYDVRTLCQAWVDDALRHGSARGVCLRLGLTPQEFSHVKRGRAFLPPRIVEALGLLPVRAVYTAAIVGYVSPTPVDFSLQWTLPETGTVRS